MSALTKAPDDQVAFVEGFLWERGFVKRATRSGRPIRFLISAQLVTNCLVPAGSSLDPISAFNAGDDLVRRACLRTLEREAQPHLTMFNVMREDFD
jgi:hypothetical protein